MRYATVNSGARPLVGVIEGDRVLLLDERRTMGDVLIGARGTVPGRSARTVSREEVTLGPAIPYPGSIYTVGDNYRAPDDRSAKRPARPLIYGKAASSIGAPGTVLGWDRTLIPTVDAEVELGVVIGRPGRRLSPDAALDHVFGYTIVNDVSSRDPWLDGDQWLLGKSMPGFCPVGPWIVTRDELDPADLRLGCMINGEPIQDGRTSQMRFSIAEIVSFLSQHLALRPGDLIATGTPARLAGPPGPDRHLETGDVITCWIEGIGELTTSIA
jgi:2-keto-4-pentenoate hydratase/2-oxohepta-3-ene-1,7-dioic acid hydratase in catechol pathway